MQCLYSLRNMCDRSRVSKLLVGKWLFPFREKPEEAFQAAKSNQTHTVKSVTLKSAHIQEELQFLILPSLIQNIQQDLSVWLCTLIYNDSVDLLFKSFVLMQWFVYLLFYMFCSFCVWCHFCCEFSNCGLCLCSFSHRFIQHPKNFGLIASFLERKVLIKIFWYFCIIQSYFQKYVARCHFFFTFQTVAECVLFYYLTKKNENYKNIVRRSYRRRGRSQVFLPHKLGQNLL